MSPVAYGVLLLCLALSGLGCQNAQTSQRQRIAPIHQKAIDPSDWGPAYVPGMESGPASAEASVAMHLAEKFIANQEYSNLYAKRACVIAGIREGDDIVFDVSFAFLADNTGMTRGIVRVNLKSRQSKWLGMRTPPNQAL